MSDKIPNHYFELGNKLGIKGFPNMIGKIIEVESEYSVTYNDVGENVYSTDVIAVYLELRSGHKLHFFVDELIWPNEATRILYGGSDYA